MNTAQRIEQALNEWGDSVTNAELAEHIAKALGEDKPQIPTQLRVEEVVGYGQSRNHTMDEVIIALKEVGLHGKLVNEALQALGYKLIPFPAPCGERK